MYELKNISFNMTKSTLDQIDNLISEIEKNIKYLDIFPGQELAKAMMNNNITQLKQIRVKIVAESAKKIPTFPKPSDFEKPVTSPGKFPWDKYPDAYPPFPSFPQAPQDDKY